MFHNDYAGVTKNFHVINGVFDGIVKRLIMGSAIIISAPILMKFDTRKIVENIMIKKTARKYLFLPHYRCR